MSDPNSPNLEQQLVRYLLGQLPPEEREALERQYLAAPEFLEQLEAAESDLIERYLDRVLSQGDRADFEREYGETEQRRRRVQLIAALRRRFKTKQRRRFGPWAYGLAASFIAIASASVTYLETRPPAPVLLAATAHVRSLGALRDRVVVKRTALMLRLRLDAGTIDAARVERASLRLVETETPVWSEQLQAHRGDRFIDLAIQNSILHNQDYILTLGTQSETLVSYTFRLIMK